MSEEGLKKEFSKKDVTRLRNIITKKYGEKTNQGIGYSIKNEFHEEGAIWEDGEGRQWTIKDGLKQNITKLDKFKKTNLFPLFCPECSKIMNNPNDKTFYNLHKKCFNCIIEFETKLRQEGKWDEYQNKIHNDEIDKLIEECKFWLENELKESNKSFITEDGVMENWIGDNKEKIKINIQESIKHLETLKK